MLHHSAYLIPWELWHCSALEPCKVFSINTVCAKSGALNFPPKRVMSMARAEIHEARLLSKVTKSAAWNVLRRALWFRALG